MISFKSLKRKGAEVPEALTWRNVYGVSRSSARDSPVSAEEALKISAFYRAVDIRSDSIGKLPVKVKDTRTRQEQKDHYLTQVLQVAPNEAMTPFIYRKLVETRRIIQGNAYVWIYRSGNGYPVETIPLPPGSCTPYVDPLSGKLWYIAQDPKSGQLFKLHPEDILHYKGVTLDGINGISLLSQAARVLRVEESRDQYEYAVYQNGGHPAGVLQTESDLSRIPAVQADGSTVNYKDTIRKEWERIHAGPGNAFRVAVLDNGLKYTPISMSHADAQFVQSKAVTVEDIARFTGVPQNLLFTGKQSYSSNEQNSLDYVKYTLHPTVLQYEEEDSRKLLVASDLENGMWVERNMMAELRGDSASRMTWYRGMREIGAISVNEIREKEDMGSVEGGDELYASLNYVPLSDWAELSKKRNSPTGTI